MSRLRERGAPVQRLDALTFRSRITAFDERGYDPYVDHHAGVLDPKIRCPSCQWQPARNTRWWCFPMGPPENFPGGCGHGWNTFDTRGLCPGCSYQWQHTTCLSCNVTSVHADWYDKSGGQP